MTRKKFGEIALLKKFITQQQLEEALKEQGRIIQRKEPYKKIGVILHEMGAMEQEQVEWILKKQEPFFLWHWFYEKFGKDAK